MAYSDFTLEKALQDFGLTEIRVPLFADAPPLKISDWLRETLALLVDFGLTSGNEKARSEFIVAPILAEVARRNENRIALHSGKNLNVAPEQGLNGECDFILSRSRLLHTIQAPLCAVVEAKKGELDSGLGQCVAQMVGAQLFNEQRKNTVRNIFGCVTSGEDWQFLKLDSKDVLVDNRRYYLNEVEQILGILQSIVEQPD